MFDQRDIVLVPFPYSDLTGSKQRPALIISNNKLNKSEDRLCCLITSNLTKEGLKLTKNSFEKGSLPFESWVKSFRVFTIHERAIKKKLCRVTKEFHNKVISNLESYIRIDQG